MRQLRRRLSRAIAIWPVLKTNYRAGSMVMIKGFFSCRSIRGTLGPYTRPLTYKKLFFFSLLYVTICCSRLRPRSRFFYFSDTNLVLTITITTKYNPFPGPAYVDTLLEN